MSELKAYKMVNELKWNWAYAPYLDPPEKQKESALKAGYIKVVNKSEADKVIAELKKKIEEQKRLRNMALASVPNALKVAKIIQHNKYKRCLAMARLCDEKWIVHNFAEIPTKLGFYDKWEKRWLELAEEPTWAKFLQLIHKEEK